GRDGAGPSPLYGGLSRPRPADPHLRRAPALQFSALAGRLRRIPRDARPLARLRPPTPFRGDPRLPAPGPAVRAGSDAFVTNHLQRVLFAAVAIPLALGIVWYGGLLLALLVAVAGVLGTRELFALAEKAG